MLTIVGIQLVSQLTMACSVEADTGEIAADCNTSIDYLIYGTSGVPLQIVHPNGDVSGFITDVVNEVFTGSDISLTASVKPIARHKGAMINGSGKRWIAYALNSWRKETVWENATFAEVELLPYVLSLGYKDLGEWPPPIPAVDVNELAEKGVVWIRGFKYPGTTEFSEAYGFEFDRAKNHEEMLHMVEADRARYFMEHAPRMKYVMKQQGIDVGDYDFFSLASYVSPTSLTLLMSNDLGPEVIALVNRRLQEMADSGRFAVLAQPYGL